MFPMTVTVHNATQLSAVMAVLNAAVNEPVITEPVKTVPQPAPEKIQNEPEKTPEVAPEEDAQKEKPETLTQMTGGEAKEALNGHANTPAEAPTYQQTAEAVTNLARIKGRDAAVAVLLKFGAAKLPDVQPDQFAAVIAECEAGAQTDEA